MGPLLGGIEAGGTKFICVTGHKPGEIEQRAVIPTTTPEETLGAAIAFFREHGPVASLGVASFGPLVLDKASPRYGQVAATPKAGWTGADLSGVLAKALGCPVNLDTDVNGAGLAEARLGAAQGLDVVVYITVGTGLGGGLIVDGKPVQGLTHPEMGHVRVRRHPLDEGFKGVCPFHGDCMEGLTSGPAVMARLGFPLNEAPLDHPIWNILGYYLGELCASLCLIASPRQIILGGGVMSNHALFPLIRTACAEALAGYVQHPDFGSERFIVPPGLGDKAGAIGALLLAQDVLADRSA